MRTAIFKDDKKYLTDKPIDIDVVSPGQKLTINGLDYIAMEISISITNDLPVTQYLLVKERLTKKDIVNRLYDLLFIMQLQQVEDMEKARRVMNNMIEQLKKDGMIYE